MLHNILEIIIQIKLRQNLSKSYHDIYGSLVYGSLALESILSVSEPPC